MKNWRQPLKLGQPLVKNRWQEAFGKISRSA
jgi:hypothetical protein